ncbi:MAG: ABC transporter permease [Dehalococcoidales bacterium]|nr:ABC transporter permease [Dehalococcoidales bacterium]
MTNDSGTIIQTENTELEVIAPHYSETRRVIRIFFGRKIAVVGLVFICLIVFAAIFGPLISPYDPDLMMLDEQLAQPSWSHLLGTDSLGRDTLSRVIYGCRTSLIVGFSAVIIAALIGETMGLIAAHYGGLVFAVIMRFTDALMSIPMMLNAFVIAAVLGGGLKNVIIALAIGGLAGHCRMMCGMALTIKQNDYMMAGRSLGASDLRMMLRHIFPNAFPALLVMITMNIGMVILSEAALSFLGIGIVSPIIAWGSMINDGYKYLLTNPILSFAPGVAIMMVVFGFNMMGDGLRDSLDPKLRGTL